MTGPESSPLLGEGAEAQVIETRYLGIPALRKHRIVKAYRPPALDQRLRTERLRMEVRLLREARGLGIRTPFVLDIDLEEGSFVMERVPGRSVTEILEADAADGPENRDLLRRWGEAVGRLHRGNISHGDLTGSNVLWTGQEIVLLDLSMGSHTPELEEFGIDLHLVEEDLNTLSPDAGTLYVAFLEGYATGNPLGAAAIRERALEIKGRVRYS